MDRDSIDCWLTDMDVLVKENNPLPGAQSRSPSGARPTSPTWC